MEILARTNSLMKVLNDRQKTKKPCDLVILNPNLQLHLFTSYKNLYGLVIGSEIAWLVKWWLYICGGDSVRTFLNFFINPPPKQWFANFIKGPKASTTTGTMPPIWTINLRESNLGRINEKVVNPPDGNVSRWAAAWDFKKAIEFKGRSNRKKGFFSLS